MWRSGRRRDGGPPPAGDEGPWKVYTEAFAEYRFQVQLNWSRSQAFLVSNAAFVAVGTGLLSLDGHAVSAFTAAVFALGVFSSEASVVAVGRQRIYYRRARDRLKTIERVVAPNLPLLDSTPGMTGTRSGTSVTTLITVQLHTISLLGVGGVAFSLSRIF